MEVLYIASSVLSLFFILILSGKKRKSFSDKILIFWFFLLFSNVFIFYLIIKDIAPSLLVDYLNNSVFLHGPLLFFYTTSLTGNLQKISLKSGIHFLPFLIFLTTSTMLESIAWKYLNWFNYTLVVLKFLVSFIYILASLKTISQHQKRITNILSSINQMELKWLSSILYGGIGLMIFGLITLFIHYFTPIEIPQFGGKYLNIAYSISIILLGYFGFRQTPIFIPAQNSELKTFFNTILESDNKNKGDIANEKDGQSEKIYRDLLHFMKAEHPYTDKNLTLYKLADQLNISENKLSLVINSQSRFNFFEFINKYRVDMVKTKMHNGEHKQSTLLGLAYDSGFNSKASFNRAFKKFTGLTPSEYLHNQIEVR